MANSLTRVSKFPYNEKADGELTELEIDQIVNTINNANSGVTSWSVVKTVTLTVTGTTTLTSLVAAGNIVMATFKITGLGNGTAAQDAVALSQLHYTQTPVQGTSTTSVSANSTTYQTSNCTATITPTSTSHKIKITAVFTAKLSAGDADAGAFTIFRGSTNLGSASGLAIFQVTSAVNQQVPCCLTFLDSPGSASATTYVVKYKNFNGVATVGVGADFTTDTQTMILEEVI